MTEANKRAVFNNVKSGSSFEKNGWGMVFIARIDEQYFLLGGGNNFGAWLKI